MAIVFDDDKSQKSKIVFDDENKKPSLFQRFGGALPMAGGVIGGLAGAELGPGAIATAGFGGAAGEAGRQLLGRALGEPSPQTSLDAAKKIGVQGGLNAAGEGGGQVLGQAGKMLWKGLPKIAQAVSGTPARNIAKAQIRGLPETYFPKIARGLSRKAAGDEQGAIENGLLMKYFHPDEISKIKLNKTGYANQVVEQSYGKVLSGRSLSVPDALKTVKAVDSVYRDTPVGSKVAPELAKLRRHADAIIARAHPEYKAAKQATEATILKDQLSKPFRVNKTRPDEYSGFAGALLPFELMGAYKMGGTGAAAKAALGAVGASPLAFGLGASAVGSFRNIVDPMVRKALQRLLVQGGVQAGTQSQP